MAGYLQGSGSIALSEINSVFDGRGLNLNAYRGTQWYTAGGGSGTFPTTAISFSDFYGKGPSPAITISLASITSNEPFEGSALAPGEPCAVNLDFNSDGTWDAVLEALGGIDGNWATPTTANIGSSYWIRFTRTFFSAGFGNSASGSTGWVQLTSGEGVQVYNSGTNSSVSATYTIEISTNSSGTNIVASASGIDLVANLFGT